ncbi:HD domain-containing protein [Marinicrinis lubricantis]|uniref:5'-deoxynucleotidase n=1 Tax=Marinicrinis lubricantis TaxID=2086470 RepID=A0ABW1ITK3_9BACL
MDKLERLQQQMSFLVEIDKLKTILRQSYVVHEHRRENDAEHTWHIALMAALLSEYADEELDLLRTVRMLLVHDLVEIDAGDTFAYDVTGHQDKLEREEKAAKRLFSILPEDQQKEYYELWKEYEDRQTPEARYALVMDRLQPMLQNVYTKGASWRKHGVTADQVIHRASVMKDASVQLHDFALRLIENAVKEGILLPGTESELT